MSNKESFPKTAPPAAVILRADTEVRLWGLSSRERITRVLAGIGIKHICAESEEERLPESPSLLLLRGDYLYDDRTLKSLAENPGTILKIVRGNREIPVAAHIETGSFRRVERWFREERLPRRAPAGCKFLSPRELTSHYMVRLRKFDTPFVLPLKAEFKEELEELLFSWSYKGVTDLVTKWLWPVPAKRVVKFCAEHGITPNQVTLTGFLLVIITGFLFYHGHFAAGLAAGWLMTFLDTVDGKLARVTVTSSKSGHLFDHAIDIIHPPLWYLAWGAGLTAWGQPLPPDAWKTVVWLIWLGYLGGRVVEAVFTQFLGRFGIFCWQPQDSWFRLITGRRNPCLILLTLGWLADRPDLGLWAVALWTFFSTLWLLWRLYRAFQARRRGPLKAWFEGLDPAAPPAGLELAVRTFTRRPTLLPDGSRG